MAQIINNHIFSHAAIRITLFLCLTLQSGAGQGEPPPPPLPIPQPQQREEEEEPGPGQTQPGPPGQQGAQTAPKVGVPGPRAIHDPWPRVALHHTGSVYFWCCINLINHYTFDKIWQEISNVQNIYPVWRHGCFYIFYSWPKTSMYGWLCHLKVSLNLTCNLTLVIHSGLLVCRL